MFACQFDNNLLPDFCYLFQNESTCTCSVQTAYKKVAYKQVRKGGDQGPGRTYYLELSGYKKIGYKKVRL
jgi:hypothetical protein